MFTLGRKIDFSYNTNKIILAISFIVGGIGYFITGEISSGLYLAGGTFLTWALAREVDPKHDYSAFIAVALSLVNLFYYQKIELLIIFWIILTLRLVSGISGKDATILDIVVVLGMTLYLAVNSQNVMYILPFMSAMIYLIRAKENYKASIGALVLSLLAFLVGGFYLQYFKINSIELLKMENVFIIIGIFVFITGINFIKINGLVDDKGKPANDRKIRTSQMLYGNIILLLFLFAGVGLNNLIIYFSVIIGTFLYAIVDRK